MGLFIDEVGKFMTQTNDYFFPAAAPIIYGFLLLTVLLYLQVAKRANPNKIISFENETRLTWLSGNKIKPLLIAGLLIFGVGGCVRIAYYYSGGAQILETLLYERISRIPNISSDALFLAAIQLWMEGIVGSMLLMSSILMILNKERAGLNLGTIGLVISLVGVNLLNFYFDQFATIAKALSQYLLLYLLYSYQRRETHVGFYQPDRDWSNNNEEVQLEVI
jgi:hypothetical protein